MKKRWADQFAVGASAVVASALPEASDEVLREEVQEALLSREVIAQAQGIVMHRDGLAPDAAYAVLRDASSRTGDSLRKVCERVMKSGGHSESVRGTGVGGADG